VATGLQCTAHSADQQEAIMAKQPKKLDELFHDTLKDIYFAEKKILSALPKMAKAAQSEELKEAFQKCGIRWNADSNPVKADSNPVIADSR